jgi:hypothetical protein
MDGTGDGHLLGPTSGSINRPTSVSSACLTLFHRTADLDGCIIGPAV